MNLLRGARLAALFALLTALIVGLGWFFMGASGIVLGLLVAGAMNIGSYLYSDRLVVRMTGARELEDGEAPGLREMVAELAEEAGIPEPRLYIMETDTPNAFATGRNPENGVVCVTQGLLRRLSEDEVRGVVAHEMGHIANRDTLVQSVAGTLAGAVSMIAQLLWFSSLDGEARHPAMIFGGMLLAPVAAMMLQTAISRSREFSADRFAAGIVDPSYLADALRSIESSVSQGAGRGRGRARVAGGNQGMSHLFIINPFRGKKLSRLFSTHPPTDERVRRLRELAG